MIILPSVLPGDILPRKFMDQAGDRPFASRQRMPTGAESPLMQETLDFHLRCHVAIAKSSSSRSCAAMPEEAPSPFQSVYTAGETLTKRLADGKVRYDLVELENLRLFFVSVIEVIEMAKAGGGTAKEPAPPAGKKKILA